MTAFHFPPQAGSSGILRTLSLVRYLPERGWAPIVLTARSGAYDQTRDDLLASIPDNVQVLRAHALDAARHLSLRNKYLLLTALPDRWSSWWLDAFRIGKATISDCRPDILWSTYPIATAHLIGASLAKWSGLPWIADFRDPMMTSTFPTSRLERWVFERLEARVLREASLCVFTTERAAAQYRERYPEAASRCHVIGNGYDEEAFSGLEPKRTGVGHDTLLMLHSGAIYPKARDPQAFLQAIAGLIEHQVLDKRRLCVRFRAPEHVDEITELAKRYGLQDVIDIAIPIPHQDAIAEMMGADLLLVFQGAAFNAQIPAKIYEYARALRPILGLVDLQGDTARELSQFTGTYLADISITDDISTAIQAWFKERGPEGQSARSVDEFNVIRRFSRQDQAGRLAYLLERCLSSVTSK